MVIIMSPRCHDEDIERVLTFLNDHGLCGYPSRSTELATITVIDPGRPSIAQGENTTALHKALRELPSVVNTVSVSRPYKLASREFRPEGTIIEIPIPGELTRTVGIGGNAIVVMAGPYAIESERQLMAIAKSVKNEGAVILRGGAFKASTSPYGFRGLGKEGLKLLAKVRSEFSMAIVTEIMTPSDVSLGCEYADIIQIGSHNMQNYILLDEVGRANKPVLLKRGMSASIEEWLLAAEYILLRGNHQVLLCERGIRTFEKMTRNTMDISALALIKQLSHLPIISDPSQGTGLRELVIPMSLASIMAGADGLLIEVHPNLDEALKDTHQSLNIKQFKHLMQQVQQATGIVGRTLAIS